MTSSVNGTAGTKLVGSFKLSLNEEPDLRPDTYSSFRVRAEYFPTCPSVNESRHVQSVSVGLWIDGERGVTGKRHVSTEVLHVDQQLVPFPQSEVEETLEAYKQPETCTSL